MMLIRQLAFQLAQLVRWILAMPVQLAGYLLRLTLQLLALLARIIGGVSRPALRFLAYLFLLVAVVALTADATPVINHVHGFEPTTFAEHVIEVAPQSLTQVRKAVTAVHPWIWDYGLGLIIELPTFVLFGILGIAAAYAGRRRKQINIYAN